MAIKCGRCRSYHESVADVRKCFNGEDVTGTQGQLPASKCLTAPQVSYANKLLAHFNAVYTGTTPIEQLGRATDGRKLLDGLVAAREAQAHGKPFRLPENVAQSAKPVVSKPDARELPKVPKGYYATPSATGNNDLDFWFVDVVEREGQWKGFRSVSRVIGGRSNVRVKGTTRRDALVAIEKAGYEAAGMRFAQELGRCYRCGKHLTDDLSRQLGIGPVCRAA